MPDLTRQQVAEYWGSQKIPSRFAKAKRKFPRAVFMSHYAHEIWLGDLADFSKLAKFNRNYKWLLVVQDLFSRKCLGLIAQKRKTGQDTAAALRELINREGKTPKKFLTDKGGEFKGECNTVYRENGIQHYTTNDVTQKVAPVERLILTVKQRLYKIMAAQESWTWIDKMEEILNSYNKSTNRSLGMTPLEAELIENQKKVFDNTVTKKEDERRALMKEDYKYGIGQTVRIQKDQTFAKSYTGNYSNIVYVIYERGIIGGARVYKLQELLTAEPVIGTFYANELQPVYLEVSTLPKIEKIHGIRYDLDQEQVLVSYPNQKREWLFYDNLIPYTTTGTQKDES